jgi:hypothetical protein
MFPRKPVLSILFSRCTNGHDLKKKCCYICVNLISSVVPIVSSLFPRIAIWADASQDRIDPNPVPL